MKKIAVLLALFSMPTLAHASATATASIENFGYEVIFGTTPDFDATTFFASSVSTLSSGLVDSDFASSTPFSIHSSVIDSLALSNGTANTSSAHSHAESSTHSDAQNVTYGGITIQYTHGTLLHFFGEASVFGANNTSLEYSTSSAFISASTFSTAGAETQFNSELTAEIADGGLYSKTDTLNLYFYSAQDQTIYFQAGVSSIAQAIPEPETLALMLMGLGVVSLSTKKKKYTR